MHTTRRANKMPCRQRQGGGEAIQPCHGHDRQRTGTQRGARTGILPQVSGGMSLRAAAISHPRRRLSMSMDARDRMVVSHRHRLVVRRRSMQRADHQQQPRQPCQGMTRAQTQRMAREEEHRCSLDVARRVLNSEAPSRQHANTPLKFCCARTARSGAQPRPLYTCRSRPS